MPLISPTQANGPEQSHHVPEPFQPSHDDQTPPEPNKPKTRRRLRSAVGALCIAGAAGCGLWFLSGGDETTTTETAATPIRAVEAATADLSESITIDGTLSYADPVTHVAASDGVITRTAEVDDVLGRGDMAYAVNEQPVVVLWGDIPSYRPIGADTTDGADVEMVEANLAALGFTADGALVVDEHVDTATITAIEAFETNLGIDTDGIIDPAQALVVAGPVIVSDVTSPVGSTARVGNPVLSVQLINEATTVRSSTDGLLTMVPSVGDSFETGETAYEIDTHPVTVIIGDAPIRRVLAEGVEDGADIELLESTLAGLGFDADGKLEVDEHFDEATATALAAWEDTLGIEPDGVAQLDQFVVLPARHQVTDVPVERGDQVEPGDTVFDTGVSTRTLTGVVDEADADDVTLGAVVEIAIGDQTVPGTVVDIADPVSSPADPNTETVTFTIEPNRPIATDESVSDVGVEITITTILATDVTLVPATALISAGDGTYAVEVVRGDTTAFVAVQPGTFADGMVEVTGIEPGDAVVVP
ncbi:MAG: peptidoglycan-binding protein [Acidimicrobiales bacterium]